jgi:hypothetical protein
VNPDISLAHVTASLEAQIAYHREQEALHSEREAFHREKQAAHAVELEQLTQSLDALRSAARTAAELAARTVPDWLAVPAPRKTKRSGRTTLHQAVKAVLKTKGAHEVFGARAIATEVNQHFRDELRKPVNTRQTSVALRWLARRGWIAQIRKGRPFWEGQYTRQALK